MDDTYDWGDKTLYGSYRLPDGLRKKMDSIYEAQRQTHDRVFGSPEFQEMWYLSQITERRIDLKVVHPEDGTTRVVMTLEEAAHE